MGAGFALLGMACIGYAFRRQAAVEEAIQSGRYAPPDARITLALTLVAVVLGEPGSEPGTGPPAIRTRRTIDVPGTEPARAGCGRPGAPGSVRLRGQTPLSHLAHVPGGHLRRGS